MEEKLLELEAPSPENVMRLVANEVPFVMRGLCRDWPALAKWDFPYLTRKLKETPGKVYKGTFRTREGVLPEEIPTHEAVRHVLYHEDNFRIVENMAIWLSAQSNVTTMHYDGYSFDGFNVQVKGHKTFVLCHPDLECVMAPFLQGAVPHAKDEEARRRVTSYTVEMRPGDCLYTPRFWYHTVTARADSANVQYHFARKKPPSVESRAMRHYINNAWIVANSPYLIPRAIREGISEYVDIVELYAAKARPQEARLQAIDALVTMVTHVVAKPLMTTKLLRQYRRRTLDELGKPL